MTDETSTEVEIGDEITEENVDVIREQLDEIIDEELFMRVFNENAFIIGQIAPKLTKKQLLTLLQLSVEYPIAKNAKIKGREMRQVAAALKEGREAMIAFILKMREEEQKAAKIADEMKDVTVF